MSKLLSKNVYRAGELKVGRSQILLGERPGLQNLRTRYLRDVEDEISRLQSELNHLRSTYEGEARSMAESYGQKKAALESELVKIKNSCEEEAKRIRDSAAEEVAKEKKRGYDEGFSAGRKEGHEDASNLIASDLKEMQNKISGARQAFLDRVLAMETKLIETSLAIAEKIVRQKIQIDPGVVRETVREAVMQIRENHPVRIRVHPSDVSQLEEFQKHSPDAFRGLMVTFLPDENINPGDCVAETGLEFIDATVHKKLETLRDRLIPRSVL